MICTMRRLNGEIEQRIKKILLDNGYPKNVINTQITKKIAQFSTLKRFGPEKYPVYLRVPWIGKPSTNLEKEVQTAVESCYDLVLKPSKPSISLPTCPLKTPDQELLYQVFANSFTCHVIKLIFLALRCSKMGSICTYDFYNFLLKSQHHYHLILLSIWQRKNATKKDNLIVFVTFFICILFFFNVRLDLAGTTVN